MVLKLFVLRHDYRFRHSRKIASSELRMMLRLKLFVPLNIASTNSPALNFSKCFMSTNLIELCLHIFHLKETCVKYGTTWFSAVDHFELQMPVHSHLNLAFQYRSRVRSIGVPCAQLLASLDSIASRPVITNFIRYVDTV